MSLKAQANVSGQTIDSPTFTGVASFADGTTTIPSIAFIGQPTTGFSRPASNSVCFIGSGTLRSGFVGDDIALSTAGAYKWSSGATLSGSYDTFLTRAAAGAVLLAGASNADAVLRSAGGNGGYWERGSITENLTLSTGGTTTDTAANLLPANSIIEAVTARVTTTIATATNWSVGDATTAARFSPSNSTLTAGTTSVGITQCDQTGAAGPKQTSAAKVRITTTGTPSAGAIRLTSYYRTFVPATS